MARMMYVQPCSLDLRIADAEGDFGWAEPPEAVHAFTNDLIRPIGTHVHGRRMWETMRFWESVPEEDSVTGDFGAMWRAGDEVVVSTSLRSVDTGRTELVPRFDADDLRRRKREATADLAIGGAALAGTALRAGLVDEVRLLIAPVLVGSGPRALPDGVRARLEPLGQQSLDGGWTSLHCAVHRA